MGSLESLTKEELIGWIRENHTEINEECLVVKILHQRLNTIRERIKEADDRFWAANEQIRKLLEEHSDGEIKPGKRLPRWSAAAQTRYNELNQERQAARKEWQDLQEQDKENFRRFIGATDRTLAFTDEVVERFAGKEE